MHAGRHTLWFSRALSGRTHDLNAARARGIVQVCLTRQILILADRTDQGAGATVRTPYYRHSIQPRSTSSTTETTSDSEHRANAPSHC